jgi:hypothetical protein
MVNSPYNARFKLEKMTLNEKNIFLLDGLGAIFSIFLLAVALPAIQPWIGMPLHILYFLAIFPAIYAVYSLSCFRFVNHQDRRWLKAIMWGNSLYCVLTLILVVHHFSQMMKWGIIYFIVEALVLLGLVMIEGKIAFKPPAAHR